MFTKNLISSFIFLAIVLVAPTASLAKKDWPMVCRGGDIGLEAYNSMSKSTNTVLYLFFKKGRHAGSAGKLQAGECAFLDRALRPKEPTTLQYIINRGMLYSVKWNAGTNKIARMAFNTKDGKLERKVNKLIQNAGNPNSTFYVRVNRSKDGKKFKINSIGP